MLLVSFQFQWLVLYKVICCKTCNLQLSISVKLKCIKILSKVKFCVSQAEMKTFYASGFLKMCFNILSLKTCFSRRRKSQT